MGLLYLLYTFNTRNLSCFTLSFIIIEHYITIHYALYIINTESASDLRVKIMPWTRFREPRGTNVTHIT